MLGRDAVRSPARPNLLRLREPALDQVREAPCPRRHARFRRARRTGVGRRTRDPGPYLCSGSAIRRIVAYRELLVGMTRKELKVKYKNSILGFAWSLLNPLLYLVVFYIAFVKILGSGVPAFPIYLLSGLLVWNLFSTGLGGATGSVVGNAGLVKKVWFPREILPLASIGSMLVHFFLQSLVLLTVIALVQWRRRLGVHPAAASGPPLVAVAHRRVGHPVERDQRVPAGHAALPRARTARVVLGHADRLRLHDDRPPPRRLVQARVPAQPGHADRADLPARDLQQARQLADRGRQPRPPDPPALAHWAPTWSTSGTRSCSARSFSRSRSACSVAARRTSPRSSRSGPPRSRSAASPSSSSSTTSTTPR